MTQESNESAGLKVLTDIVTEVSKPQWVIEILFEDGTTICHDIPQSPRIKSVTFKNKEPNK